MRKVLILLTLVIVLVSLNWFRELLAQDLSALSEADKKALLEKLNTSLPAQTTSDNYQTAPIFESDVGVGRPEGEPGVETSNSLPAFGDLRPFGVELFAGPREIVPPNDIASDDSYILGPGDNVIIYLWGRVEKEYNLTVDREGKIFVPKIGEVVVWGKSLHDFKVFINRKLSKVYTDFQLAVSLGKIRSIRIYLTGEVRRPGAYTVSSLTSLFNALYMAGGPNNNGSMRSIRLMRNGKCADEVDLYRFLLEGDNSSDTRLESGDAIFVPVAGARVAIRGEITRPGIYELKGSETAQDLLLLAGGASPEAYLDRVMLERVADREEWEVLDLDLGSEGMTSKSSLTLMDGDRITVFSVFQAKKNMVAIFGQVKHPGYYERTDSIRISNLIEQGQLQDYDVHYERMNLFRRHSDWRTEVIPLNLRAILNGEEEDILLQDSDSLHIYSIQDVNWDKYVHINGEIDRPGSYPFYDKMTVRDLIFLAGSYVRGAQQLQAEIARVDEAGEVTIQFVSLIDGSADSTRLQEDDRVYIRQVPEWRIHRTVRIEGEVLYPGEYVLSSRDETLYDLLQRAGGFTPSAFPYGTVFERQSIGKNLERLQIQKQLEKSTPLVKDSLDRLIQQNFVEYETSSVNRIVIDMDMVASTEGARGDVILEPGDRVYVPPKPSGVSVLGAVGINGTFKFQEDAKVKFYVAKAGGFTPRADKKETRLIKANGEVESGHGIMKRRVGLGDIITVPSKIKRERDWNRTLNTVVTMVTGALTTVFLITNL